MRVSTKKSEEIKENRRWFKNDAGIKLMLVFVKCIQMFEHLIDERSNSKAGYGTYVQSE